MIGVVMEHGVMVNLILGVCVITVRGPLKYGDTAVDDLRRAWRDVSAHNHRRVVIDLGDVPAIDSSGIGALLQGYTSLHKRGGECILLRPSRIVVEVLRVVGLHGLLPICYNLDEALAA